MRRFVTRLLVSLSIVGSLASAGALAQAPAAAFDPANPKQALPSHPDVVSGVFDNGLAYRLMRNSLPAGHVYIALYIDSGSMNETDKQRGIAHFLEHLAFNGSANFAPGTLIPYFESLGLTFGRHQNASTGFDATNYVLDLPKNDEATIAKGLLFMSDVAGRLDLRQEEIEKERQIILEEKRARLSPVQRIFDETLPKQYPGSRVAVRLPIGVEETIRGVNRQDFVDYYSKWYTTGNMTLVIVGDAEIETMRRLATEAFASIPKGAKTPGEDAGIRTPTESRAVVGADAELPYCGVEVNMIAPGLPPVTTVGDARRELIERIGSFAFNRRVRAKVDAGQMKFRGASASVSDLFRTSRQASVQAIGEAKDWRTMLAQLGEETQRARQHGFTDREIEDARREMLNQAENAVKRESTIASPAWARAITRSVADREPFMSSQQGLDLMAALLPTVTAKEVSEAFARNFDPASALFVLNMPAPKPGEEGAEPVASESEVAEVGRAAFGVKTAADAERARPDKFMKETPKPGTVAEAIVHPHIDVQSSWLSNGVRLHHRYMDYRKNNVTVTITLAGGQIEETKETRGFTQAGTLAWSRPSTRSLSSEDIRDLLLGKDVRVFGGAGRDTVSLSVSGAPADLETGLQLAHLLLTEPRIETAAWDQWKQAAAQGIKARKSQPAGVMAELVTDTLFPKDDPRMRPLEKAEIDALDRRAAQAWLEGLIARAPIEVSIVGEIDRERATALALTYLGSLKSRPRIGPDALASLRKAERTPGPISKEATVETRTPQAVVMSGFYGVDATNIREDRLLDFAAQVLTSRMIQQVREEAQLVYSIRAGNRAEEAYPGFGVFSANAPTEPAKAAALAKKLPEMFEAFAKDGPTPEEIEVARGQILNTVDESMKEPGFWTGYLSDMTMRGLSLDQVLDTRNAFAGYTLDDVLGAFRKYWKPEGTMTFIVLPKEPANGAEAAPAPAPK